MELRLVRSFLTLAQELSFSRAALRLEMTQPHLSRQIVALEHGLGATLFVRTKRHVALTPAGELLLDRAPTLLSDWAHLQEKVREVASPTEQAVLKVGIKPGATGPLAAILRRHAATTTTRVDLVRRPTAQLLEDVRATNLDAAFVLRPGGSDAPALPDLGELESFEEACGIGMEAGGPQPVHVRDLPLRPWLVCPRASNPAVVERLVEYLREQGWPEESIVEKAADESTLALVAAGRAYCFLLPSMCDDLRRDVAFVPLAEAPILRSSLVWRNESKSVSKALRQLMDAVEAVRGS